MVLGCREGDDRAAAGRVGQGLLDEEEQALHVQVEGSFKVICGGHLDVLHRRDPCVGNQHVDLAGLVDGGLNERFDAADAPGICLHGVRFLVAKCRDELVRNGAVAAVVHDHFGAELYEGGSSACSNAF